MRLATTLLGGLLIGALAGCSFTPTWPTTSTRPAPVLDHAGFGDTLRREGIDGGVPWRLAVFGDQRAMADGEFQALVRSIAAREAEPTARPPLAAILDTGDIVDDGRHADQFSMLARILEPLRRWPYLVAVGNHELGIVPEPAARDNLVRFMGDAPGPLFGRNRLWYRLDAPGVRLIFLDSNDWVYGPGEDQNPHRTQQLAWLSAQMAERFDGRTIVVMHHPIVSSSQKHRDQSSRMWGIRWDDRILAQMFLDGGVDLVFTGHTHTFERYRITGPGQRSFELVNVSGRPRDSLLWFGDGARRARDIGGRELRQLERTGWRAEDLEGFRIEQLDFLAEADEENQWAEVTVHPRGPIEVEMFFLVDRGAKGYASRGSFTID